MSISARPVHRQTRRALQRSGSNGRPSSCWHWAVLLLVLASVAWSIRPAVAQSESDASASGAVYVLPITGEIDLGLAPYLIRVLDEAAAEGAAAVLLPINTPGGRLDAVLQMRDALLGSEVRTIAFVDRTAFSAGALIAIASEEIYMAPGAVMGAATPVDGATGEAADAKVISAVSTMFKATAEARGRDPRVAEAMVDMNVAIEGLVTRGELLTLTTNEAIVWGYAEGVAATRADVLAAAGLQGAAIVDTAPSPAEGLVRFITDPLVSSLFIAAGMLLLIGDFFVEGFGFAGAAGLGLLALFFWGHSLAGLTGWEDIALVILGLLLIAIEIAIVPGFGIPGLLGFAALLGGLFLAMLGRDIQTPEGIERAVQTIGISFVVIVFGLIAILTQLSRGRRPGRLVLQSAVGGTEVVAAPPRAGWLDWFGSSPRLAREPAAMREPLDEGGITLAEPGDAARDVAPPDPRRSGIASIGRRRVDAITEGEQIDAGEPVTLVRDEGYRRVARRPER